MSFIKSCRRLMAGVVAVAFFATNTLTPVPAAQAATEVFGRESQIPDFKIPAEFGRVAELRQGPQGGPLVIHIQEAHANYDAQKNIRNILQHLSENYGVKLVLLEGAGNKLQPEFFKIFPKDPALQAMVNDKLLQAAELTGAEAFLMNASEKNEGWGVEDAKAYGADLAAYRTVYAGRRMADNFLRSFYLRWQKHAVLSMSKTLRGFLDRETAFEEERLPLQDWMKFMKDTAAREAGLDLEDIREQKDWPVLTRYFRLKAIDSKVDASKVEGEKKKFLNEMVSLKVQTATLEEIEAVFEAAKQHNLPPYKTRFIFERLMDQLPKDFSFEAYPNLRFFLQQIILLSELQSDQLQEEIRALTDQLTAQLVKTDEDKKLAGILQDYRLLKKLLRLELSRKESQETQARKITPAKLIARLNLIPHRLTKITSLLGTAIQFYEGAIKREHWMMQKALERMRDLRQTKAALITGGFHTEGLKEKILSSGGSYIEIAPRIGEISPEDQKNYLATLLGQGTVSRSYIAPKVRSEFHFWRDASPSTYRRDWAVTGARVSGIVGSIHPQGAQIVRQRFISTAVGSGRSEARKHSEDGKKTTGKAEFSATSMEARTKYFFTVKKVFNVVDAANRRFLEMIARDNIALELAGPISFGARSETRSQFNDDLNELVINPLREFIQRFKVEPGLLSVTSAQWGEAFSNIISIEEALAKIFLKYEKELANGQYAFVNLLDYVVESIRIDVAHLLVPTVGIAQSDFRPLLSQISESQNPKIIAMREAANDLLNSRLGLFSTNFDRKEKNDIARTEVNGWISVFPFIKELLVNSVTGEIRYKGEAAPMTIDFDFWVSRHGETLGNSLKVLQGQWDTPGINQLNEKGREQARGAAEALYGQLKSKIESGEDIVVVSSPLGRSKESAKIFLDLVRERAGRELAVIEEEDATEISFGISGNHPYQTLTEDQKKVVASFGIATEAISSKENEIRTAWMGGNAIIRFQEGESFLDVMIRTKRLLESLNARFKGKTVVLVGHGTQIIAMKVLLRSQLKYLENGSIDWRHSELGNSEVQQIAEKSRSEARRLKSILMAGLAGGMVIPAQWAFAEAIKPSVSVTGPGQLSINAPWQGSYQIQSASQLGGSNLWQLAGSFASAGPLTIVPWVDLSMDPQKKFYRAAFEPLPLPDGWGRNASNPNFANKTDSPYVVNPGTGQVILTKIYRLKNLLTGAEMVLDSSTYTDSYSGYQISSFIDPAGKVLIYHKVGNVGYGDTRTIYIQSLINPALSRTIADSSIRSVDFSSAFAVITTGDGDGIIKTVDPDTLAITLSPEETAYLAAQSNADSMKRFIWGYILKRNYIELVQWAGGVAPYFSFPDNGTRPFSQFSREFPLWKLQQLAREEKLQFYDVGQDYVSAQVDVESMKQFITDYLWHRGYNIVDQGWLSGLAFWYAYPDHGGRSFENEFVPEMDQIIQSGAYVTPRSEVRGLPKDAKEFKAVADQAKKSAQTRRDIRAAGKLTRLAGSIALKGFWVAPKDLVGWSHLIPNRDAYSLFKSMVTSRSEARSDQDDLWAGIASDEERASLRGSISREIQEKGAIIYEINSRQLRKKFGEITDEELDGIRKLGTNVLWMMGVWKTSDFSERFNKAWEEPGKSGRVASAYAIDDYALNEALGDEASFRDFVIRANRKGMKVALDFVPNHMAADSVWVREHPEWFVQDPTRVPTVLSLEDYLPPAVSGPNGFSTEFYRRQLERVVAFAVNIGGKIYRIAHGRRDYDGGNPWQDTAQFNLSHPGLQEKLGQVFSRILDLTNSGAVRVDMAHYTLKDHINDAWLRPLGQKAMEKEFMQKILSEAKAEYPEAWFFGESYEQKEGLLQQIGINGTYDSYLYHSLVDARQPASEIISYLTRVPAEYLRNTVHYILNHDDPPAEMIANKMGPDAQMAAMAVLSAASAGNMLIYMDQEKGFSKGKPSANWIRPAEIAETVDTQLQESYRKLMEVTQAPLFRKGEVRRLPARKLQMSDHVVAVQRKLGEEQALVLVNYAQNMAGMQYVPDLPQWGIGKDEAKNYEWKDLLTGDTFPLDQNMVLAGWESRILVLNKISVPEAQALKKPSIISGENILWEGVHERNPDWQRMNAILSVLLRLDRDGKIVSLKELLREAGREIEDQGLKTDDEAVSALLERLAGPGMELLEKKEGSFVLAQDPRFIAVKADDAFYIKEDLETNIRALEEEPSVARKNLEGALADYARVTKLWNLYPIESRWPVLRAVSLLEQKDQETLVDFIKENEKVFGTDELVDSILLMLNAKPLDGWLRKYAPRLVGRTIYYDSPETVLLAGGLGRVGQFHTAKASELVGKDAEIVLREPLYHYRLKADNETEEPIDYAKAPKPVKDLKLAFEFDVLVRGNPVPAKVFEGKTADGMRVYLIDGGDYYTRLLYRYDNPAKKWPSYSEFVEFFTRADIELTRRLELQQVEEKSGKKAPVLWINDGQMGPAAAYKAMLDRVDATLRDAFVWMVTHTYRNRGWVESGPMGFSASVWSRLFWNNDFHQDPTSSGIRSADGASAVAAVHRYEVAGFDPSAKVTAITNGDARNLSNAVFRAAAEGLFPGANVEFLTPEQIIEIKRKAKKQLSDKHGFDLDSDRIVISYSGRMVDEKAGRKRAFTNTNLRELVKAGAQVILFGNVQAGQESKQMFLELQRLAEDINRIGPGKLIVRTGWGIEDQRELLAATDLQVQDSERDRWRGTGAAEYTEADVSANAGLQMGPAWLEGIIQKQGVVLNRVRPGSGNTLIPNSDNRVDARDQNAGRYDDPDAYLDTFKWAIETFNTNRPHFASYQAASLRLSRVLDATLTSAEYLRQFDHGVLKKDNLRALTEQIREQGQDAQGREHLKKTLEKISQLSPQEAAMEFGEKKLAPIMAVIAVFSPSLLENVKGWDPEEHKILAGIISNPALESLLQKGKFHIHASLSREDGLPKEDVVIVSRSLGSRNIVFPIYLGNNNYDQDNGKIWVRVGDMEELIKDPEVLYQVSDWSLVKGKKVTYPGAGERDGSHYLREWMAGIPITDLERDNSDIQQRGKGYQALSLERVSRSELRETVQGQVTLARTIDQAADEIASEIGNGSVYLLRKVPSGKLLVQGSVRVEGGKILAGQSLGAKHHLPPVSYDTQRFEVARGTVPNQTWPAVIFEELDEIKSALRSEVRSEDGDFAELDGIGHERIDSESIVTELRAQGHPVTFIREDMTREHMAHLIGENEVIYFAPDLDQDYDYAAYEARIIKTAEDKIGPALDSVRHEENRVRKPRQRKVFVFRGMVDPDTSKRLYDVIKWCAHPEMNDDLDFDLVFQPDFEFEDPHSHQKIEPVVVFGLMTDKTREFQNKTKAILDRLFQERKNKNELRYVNIRSAEMAKEMLMIYLGAKLAHFDDVAELSRAYGADLSAAAFGAGLDKRIRTLFTNPSLGFGKRLFVYLHWIYAQRLHKAAIEMEKNTRQNAEEHKKSIEAKIQKAVARVDKGDDITEILKMLPPELHLLFVLKNILKINKQNILDFYNLIEREYEKMERGSLRDKKIAILSVGAPSQAGGITASPALLLIDRLFKDHGTSEFFIADLASKAAFEDWINAKKEEDPRYKSVRFVFPETIYEAARLADLTIIPTDNNEELKNIDIQRLSRALGGKPVFDGMNLFGLRADGSYYYKLEDVREAGINLVGVGRLPLGPSFDQASGYRLGDSTVIRSVAEYENIMKDLLGSNEKIAFTQKEVTVVGGSGYVGLVTAALFASLGHKVHVVDLPSKQAALDALASPDTAVPIYEEGLREMFLEGKKNGLIDFSTDLEAAVRNSSIVYLAVGTPSQDTGEVDLSYILKATSDVGDVIKKYPGLMRSIVIKSTVTPDTFKRMDETLKAKGLALGKDYAPVSNPEFLRQGQAVEDVTKPDRTVLGFYAALTPEQRKAVEVEMMQLWYPLVLRYPPAKNPDGSLRGMVLLTDTGSATIIKYLANSFLAISITLSNIFAASAEWDDADFSQIRPLLLADDRIGKNAFLWPGCGYGGSCFPKDVLALRFSSKKATGHELPLISIATGFNEHFKKAIVMKAIDKVTEFPAAEQPLEGKTITMLGITFKPDTDDTREASSVYILYELLKRGASRITLHDPIFTIPDAPPKAAVIDHFKEYFYKIAKEDADFVKALSDFKSSSRPETKSQNDLLWTKVGEIAKSRKEQDERAIQAIFDNVFFKEIYFPQAYLENGRVAFESRIEDLPATDVVFLVTEWKQYENLDLSPFKKQGSPLAIIDGRNLWYERRHDLKLLGQYVGVGTETSLKRSELRDPAEPFREEILDGRVTFMMLRSDKVTGAQEHDDNKVRKVANRIEELGFEIIYLNSRVRISQAQAKEFYAPQEGKIFSAWFDKHFGQERIEGLVAGPIIAVLVRHQGSEKAAVAAQEAIRVLRREFGVIPGNPYQYGIHTSKDAAAALKESSIALRSEVRNPIEDFSEEIKAGRIAFIMFKSDAMVRNPKTQKFIFQEMLESLQQKGFEIATLGAPTHFSEQQAREFYAVHQGKWFYEPLVRYIREGAVIPVLIRYPEGNAVKAIRDILPELRRQFGIEKGDKEKGTVDKNKIHASDSIDNIFLEGSIAFRSETRDGGLEKTLATLSEPVSAWNFFKKTEQATALKEIHAQTVKVLETSTAFLQSKHQAEDIQRVGDTGLMIAKVLSQEKYALGKIDAHKQEPLYKAISELSQTLSLILRFLDYAARTNSKIAAQHMAKEIRRIMQASPAVSSATVQPVQAGIAPRSETREEAALAPEVNLSAEQLIHVLENAVFSATAQEFSEAEKLAEALEWAKDLSRDRRIKSTSVPKKFKFSREASAYFDEALKSLRNPSVGAFIDEIDAQSMTVRKGEKGIQYKTVSVPFASRDKNIKFRKDIILKNKDAILEQVHRLVQALAKEGVSFENRGISHEDLTGLKSYALKLDQALKLFAWGKFLGFWDFYPNSQESLDEERGAARERAHQNRQTLSNQWGKAYPYLDRIHYKALGLPEPKIKKSVAPATHSQKGPSVSAPRTVPFSGSVAVPAQKIQPLRQKAENDPRTVEPVVPVASDPAGDSRLREISKKTIAALVAANQSVAKPAPQPTADSTILEENAFVDAVTRTMEIRCTVSRKGLQKYFDEKGEWRESVAKAVANMAQRLYQENKAKLRQEIVSLEVRVGGKNQKMDFKFNDIKMHRSSNSVSFYTSIPGKEAAALLGVAEKFEQGTSWWVLGHGTANFRSELRGMGALIAAGVPIQTPEEFFERNHEQGGGYEQGVRGVTEKLTDGIYSLLAHSFNALEIATALFLPVNESREPLTLVSKPESFRAQARFNMAKTALGIKVLNFGDILVIGRRFALEQGAIAAVRTVFGDMPVLVYTDQPEEIQFLEQMNLQLIEARRPPVLVAGNPDEAKKLLDEEAQKLRQAGVSSINFKAMVYETENLPESLVKQLSDITVVTARMFKNFLNLAGARITALAQEIQGRFALARSA